MIAVDARIHVCAYKHTSCICTCTRIRTLPSVSHGRLCVSDTVCVGACVCVCLALCVYVCVQTLSRLLTWLNRKAGAEDCCAPRWECAEAGNEQLPEGTSLLDDDLAPSGVPLSTGLGLGMFAKFMCVMSVGSRARCVHACICVNVMCDVGDQCHLIAPCAMVMPLCVSE